MTDQNTCATCDYFRTTVHGHGTCHIDPPGNSVRNGFPMVAATDWCAKGATKGDAWAITLPPLAIEFKSGWDGQETVTRLVEQLSLRQCQIDTLLSRTLWHRICNTVPWSDK